MDKRKNWKKVLIGLRKKVEQKEHPLAMTDVEIKEAVKHIDEILEAKWIERIAFNSSWHVDIHKCKCGHYNILQYPVPEGKSELEIVQEQQDECIKYKCCTCISRGL